MKLLIAAPEIVPPWTEGRKKLVRDVSVELTNYCDVRLLTTGDGEAFSEKVTISNGKSPSGWRVQFNFYRRLEREIEDWLPDVVCHFPYGTFHSGRGMVNRWSIRLIDRLCRKHKVRCLTVLYSMTQGCLTRLINKGMEFVTAPVFTHSTRNMVMGLNISHIPFEPKDCQGTNSILFMAGTQDTHKESLDYVLRERGLARLIDISVQLEKAEIEIIVAIPFLKDNKIYNKVKQLFLKKAPSLHLDLRSEVIIPEIYHEADLFIFPYNKELKQFTPTSILEAMAAGTPVVMSDLDMLSHLANSGKTAYSYRNNNPENLWTVINSALNNCPQRQKMVYRARKFINDHWSIERSARDLIEIINA